MRAVTWTFSLALAAAFLGIASGYGVWTISSEPNT